MSILSRYVFFELWKVFAVALGCLTLLMMLVGVVREAASQSLPLDEVARLMPYVLPDALRVAVPVTLLLATPAEPSQRKKLLPVGASFIAKVQPSTSKEERKPVTAPPFKPAVLFVNVQPVIDTKELWTYMHPPSLSTEL